MTNQDTCDDEIAFYPWDTNESDDVKLILMCDHSLCVIVCVFRQKLFRDLAMIVLISFLPVRKFSDGQRKFSDGQWKVF